MLTLYLMLGYPGAGKTTTARLIHELTGAEHLWADHERRERFAQPTYSLQENTALYDELNARTQELLASGKSVIYDTNFNFYSDRQKLRDIAATCGAEVQLLWVRTPKEVAKNRATQDAHKQGTRILGNMPVARFERVTANLQPPHADEPYVELDGTQLTRDYVSSKLNLQK